MRKLSVLAALAVVVTLLPSIANAQFKQGDWELTLGGSGNNNRGFTAGGFGLEGSIGYFLTKDMELAFRQNINYQDNNAGSSWAASSRGALDYHFDMGRFVPFIGVNGGYSYGGSGVSDSWEIAPEAGVKFFLNATTFIYGQAEYQIFFRNGNGPALNKGAWFYSVGLGVRL